VTAGTLIPTDPVGGPSSWTGTGLANNESWTHHLTVREIAELEQARDYAASRGEPLTSLTADDFPLNDFEATLKSIGREIEDGRGFILIRGFPVGRYEESDAALIFWGIAQHLGIPVSQNGSGDLLGHVRDLGAGDSARRAGGKMLGKDAARGYNSNIGLTYHTDGSDVVGLLCLQPSKAGGVSTLASATRIHDELLSESPELLALQYESYAHTHLAELDPGQPEFWYSPVFSHFAGKLSTNFFYHMIRITYERFPELGQLDARLPEAWRLMDMYAEQFHLDMHFQLGDMQFLNNYAVVHSRTPFEDWPEPERKRHLLRVWLTAHHGRELAPGFGRNAGLRDVRGGRGGVWRRLPEQSTDLRPTSLIQPR
jgi:hypothetical protein